MAARLLYRSLSATLREQSRRLDFTSTWPASPGLRGNALAHDSVLELSDMESTLALVEWEDLLQRPELRPKFVVGGFELLLPADGLFLTLLPRQHVLAALAQLILQLGCHIFQFLGLPRLLLHREESGPTPVNKVK